MDKTNSAKGAGVKTGLSESSGFMGEKPKSQGLDNRGKNQVPVGIPKESVGRFRFR